MLAGTVCGVVVTVLLPAATAAAAETYLVPSNGVFQLSGKGFGHGHGMSQYGAKGRAEAGHSVSSIMGFYYPGTAAGTATNSALRVALTNAGREGITPSASSANRYQCDFAGSATANCGLKVLPQAGLKVQGLNPGVSAITLPTTWQGGTVQYWTVSPAQTGGQSALQLRAQTSAGLKNYGGPDVIGFTFWRDATTTRIQYLDGRQVDYRGRIEVRDTSASRIVRLNVVAMESYLRGVVPLEMPASWHQTALRAQSVAARTYAANDKEGAGSKPFDTCDSTFCQVYLGEDVVTTPQDETPAQSNEAIAATAGQIRTYAGQGAAFTQFSASNGGYKSTGSQPYLRAGADSLDRYPTWSDDLSAAALQAAYPAVGKLSQLVITSRDGHGSWGGRIVGARLQGVRNGTATSVTVSGDDLRRVGALKSTYFTIVRPVIDTHDRFGAVATAAGAAELVSRANTGAVLSRTWSAADGLGPATALGRVTTSAPAVASEGGGAVNALAIGTDGKLYIARRAGATSAWSGWTSLGGTFSGRPAAVVSGGYLNVFVRGSDGAVMQRWRRPTMSWSPWTRVGGRMPASTGPAAVRTSDGGLQLLVHGTDHRLWAQRWTSTTGWAPTWTPLGGRLFGDTTVVTDVAGRLTAVVRGTDNAVWALDVVGSTAGSWQRLGGRVLTSPVATAHPGSARVDVLVNDTPGRLVRRTRSAGTWSTAFVPAE